MAKGLRDPNWKERVLEWKASGKSAAVWCKENNIPYNTLIGWKNRFLNPNRNPCSTPSNGFVELKDKPPLNSGIVLEYKDAKIRIESGFNPSVLKQCLACLKGMPC
jgi:hypothetical protein